jgi:hypothetical protein
MFKQIIALVALLSATAMASIPGECTPGTYRCDPSRTTIEVCDVYGWLLAADCKSSTCFVNAVDGVPYCHDA